MFKLLTDAINAALLLQVAAAPFVVRRGTSAGEFWLRSILGIGLGVVLAESGKRFEVWQGHPGFPSGHETLALAAGSCLIVRDTRWAWVAVPLALLQAWALVTARFHTPTDVAGALLTGLGPPLLCQLYPRKVSG